VGLPASSKGAVQLAREIAAAYEDREIDAAEELRLTRAFANIVRQAKPPR